MNLTENECSEALIRLLRPYYAKVDVQNMYHSINEGHSIEDDSNLLTLLIMEYFCNPPLEYGFFEDSLNLNLVFDNKFKVWRLAVGLTFGEEEIHFLNFGEKDVEVIPYEPNRFFRKEVQE